MNKLLLALSLLLISFQANADAGVGGIFGQGRTQFALMAGNGYAYNNNYLVLGASASYYVIDGLGVGLSYENWSGGDPGINKYAPFIQYVIYQASVVKPYVGAFYRFTEVSGQPGMESVGGRAGVYIASGSNSYISVGVVQESYLDCNQTAYNDCNINYAEIGFTFGF